MSDPRWCRVSLTRRSRENYENHVVASLREAAKRPHLRGGRFAKCARNDMQAKVNALPAHAFGRLQVKSGEELSPSLRSGDASALMPSVSLVGER